MIQFLSRWSQRYSHVKWVLADQVMVSGMNFLTSLLLARFLGVEGYGQFVLIYTIFLYGNIFQLAIIVTPMMSIAPQIKLEIERTNYLEGVLSVQLIFSFILGLIVLAIGSGVAKWYPGWNLDKSLLSLAASILFFQLQDWLRRYYFILGKGKAVFLNDAVSYGGQIVLLFFLYRVEKLNTVNAFWAIAVSSALAFLMGLLTENIRPVWAYASQSFKKSWRFGGNLLLAGQINWAGSQGILLFSASILGAKAVGGIRAAQNIVGPFNILFQSMENVVPVKAAQHYAQNQLTGLRNYLKKISLFGGLLLAVPCLVIALFSKQLMQFAYGEEYSAFYQLIIWQLIIAFLGFFQFQCFYFYRTINSTNIIVLNTIISSITAFLCTAFLGQKLQETGIMLALLLGQAFGLIFFIITIYRVLKKPTAST